MSSPPQINTCFKMLCFQPASFRSLSGLLDDHIWKWTARTDGPLIQQGNLLKRHWTNKREQSLPASSVKGDPSEWLSLTFYISGRKRSASFVTELIRLPHKMFSCRTRRMSAQHLHLLKVQECNSRN